MSKVSNAFGEIIKSFLERNQLTLRAAALQSEVSAAYWNDMADGRVPSEDVINKICITFKDLDENALRDAAGLAPAWDNMDIADAVALYLRHNQSIPEEGARQVIDFVKETMELYDKRERVE